jgi:hypothetical protein
LCNCEQASSVLQHGALDRLGIDAPSLDILAAHGAGAAVAAAGGGAPGGSGRLDGLGDEALAGYLEALRAHKAQVRAFPCLRLLLVKSERCMVFQMPVLRPALSGRFIRSEQSAIYVHVQPHALRLRCRGAAATLLRS